jgi:DNA-binding MarR family transcriptional regulator
MEVRGVLERRRRKDDERVVELWLTSEGRRLGLGAHKMRAHVVCKSDIPDRKAEALRTALVSLTRSLNSSATPGDPQS